MATIKFGVALDNETGLWHVATIDEGGKLTGTYEQGFASKEEAELKAQQVAEQTATLAERAQAVN